MEKNIISVQYEDKFSPKTFGGRAYSYYSIINANIGDYVIAPTDNGEKIARVAEINISEQDIPSFIIPRLKTITSKINKSEYLQNSQILKEVA